MPKFTKNATNHTTNGRKIVFYCCAAGIVSAISLFGQTNVITQHNDIGRTGQNLTETILTPANVNAAQFGKLFTLNVDGQVIAQPLYLSSVTINGAAHHVVFVATEHDSVYAFDASNGNWLWHASMLDAAHGAAPGATPFPVSETGCKDISNTGGAAPEYGITGTPVIDASRGVLYVASKTFEGTPPAAVHRLHALDITTGIEKPHSPVKILASVPGTGTGSNGAKLEFNSNWQLQRAGLLEVNGNIYMGFGSHCDYGPGADPLIWHGWILGYNATTLAQTAAFVATPNGYGSGIWMSGAGLAADTLAGNSRIFPVTGNGTFDETQPKGNKMDYGDDILELSIGSSGALSVADEFTPNDEGDRDKNDRDLGSGGALLLPDQPGPNPHLLVVLGKTDPVGKPGILYLVNRDSLGGFSGGSTSADRIVQEVTTTGGLFGVPAYWNGNLYVWPGGGSLSRYTFTNGRLAGPIEISQHQSSQRGSTPSISANGAQDGIVWSVDSSTNPQVVYANNAADVSHLLWSSAFNAAFDSAGSTQKFAVPTIADGHVFIGAVNQVQVYALIPPLSFSVSENSLFFGRYGWTFPIKITDLPTRTVQVSNSASGPLTRLNFDIGGANPGDFFSYGDCGDALTPGQTCDISVVFNPQGKGTFHGTLLVTGFSGSGSVKVAQVALSGTGLGPK